MTYRNVQIEQFVRIKNLKNWLKHVMPIVFETKQIGVSQRSCSNVVAIIRRMY